MPPQNSANGLALFRRLFWPSVLTLARHRLRSALTMLGIVIGIAAVLSMVTLGQFTKERILDSYQDLGANSLVFRGYPNWDLRGDDPTVVPFRGFDTEKDLRRLPEVFPEIKRLSPFLFAWSARASFGGRTVDREVRLAGVNEHGLSILGRQLDRGTGFSALQVERRLPVCVLGSDIARSLFAGRNPLGELINIASNEAGISCRVIGTLVRKVTNDQWSNPNSMIYVPATLFQSAISNWWESQVRTIAVQVDLRSDIARAGRGLEGFFRRKYGESGRFNVDGDAQLLSQMNRFLTLFTVLLGSIAFVSLAVGGIGIANMMLVSVNERIKEIGLRKAVGATDRSIRAQLLLESILLCAVAGVLGLVLGFALYQGAIFAATQFVPKLEFAWIVDWGALGVSLFSILAVGILSGLAPALRAERLQVIEALRSE
jgi:putative ABC transport system permease protein